MSMTQTTTQSLHSWVGAKRGTRAMGPEHACLTLAQFARWRPKTFGAGDCDCFLFLLLGQQKGAVPTGAVHDVRPDGLAVTAPLRNFAQGRAEGTEAESHVQN